MRRVTKLAEQTRIGIGRWNVGSLTGRLRELVDAAIRRRVNILCVQETNGRARRRRRLRILASSFGTREQLRIEMV